MRLEDIAKKHKVQYNDAKHLYNIKSNSLLLREFGRDNEIWDIPKRTYEIIDRYYSIYKKYYGEKND